MMSTKILRLVGALLVTLLLGSACGDVNIRNGVIGAYSSCDDYYGGFHFEVLIPPWTYNKEYRCSDWDSRQCVGTWTATGRYVFTVSDVPFVNYDSEIITSLDVEKLSTGWGVTEALVMTLITTEQIGVVGSNAVYSGAPEDYPRAIVAKDENDERLTGHEVLWRQDRSFQGNTFNWYRRDVFLQGAYPNVYHLKFFSIESLDKPEFDALLSSFREGLSEDGAPSCRCQDNHDPSGSRECL